MKAFKKNEKTAKLIENPSKDNKSMNNIPKRKNNSNDNTKSVTSETNMVSELQVSDSDQSMVTEDNDYGMEKPPRH